jgi:hypothetical protein
MTETEVKGRATAEGWTLLKTKDHKTYVLFNPHAHAVEKNGCIFAGSLSEVSEFLEELET